MTVEALLARLDAVRPSSRGFVARCPAHEDRHPSLSLAEGERGILLKCWGGCDFQEITAALGLRVKDLFFDTSPDLRARKEAQQQREQQRKKKAKVDQAISATIDALRETENFIRSRRELDISAWKHERLNDELNALADAYSLLESEGIDG